jgi:hypothetical protein
VPFIETHAFSGRGREPLTQQCVPRCLKKRSFAPLQVCACGDDSVGSRAQTFLFHFEPNSNALSPE